MLLLVEPFLSQLLDFSALDHLVQLFVELIAKLVVLAEGSCRAGLFLVDDFKRREFAVLVEIFLRDRVLDDHRIDAAGLDFLDDLRNLVQGDDFSARDLLFGDSFLNRTELDPTCFPSKSSSDWMASPFDKIKFFAVK